jgi:hypothetical protein
MTLLLAIAFTDQASLPTHSLKYNRVNPLDASPSPLCVMVLAFRLPSLRPAAPTSGLVTYDKQLHLPEESVTS